ncbi:phage holin family protein [Microlunatus elymi]|uniref:Phage holin family protein n=1 Tax=Microlunatus elymi TaxID=2596828 RepID=A0A516PVX7_9ACTN|nr:phage holin family protein [Microlunatus elymi]QDP95111.1 phage holin family protein [Microlunatus elymi]
MANSRSEQTPGSTPEAPGVADIVKDIQGDIRTLIQGEVELAKQELMPSAQKAGAGAGMFSGALYLVLNALILLFIAGALFIWQWLDVPIAVAFVIMAGVLVVIAGVLGLIGYVLVRKIKGPERAIAQGQQTANAVKAAIARGNAAATAKTIEATPAHAALPTDSH